MPIHRRLLALASLALITGCSTPSNLAYQSVQDARVLDEFRLAGRIDDSTFRGAAGVVVLEVGRGGFVVGLTAGHGVAVRRLGDHWSPPLPLDVVAGSLGFQIGGEGGRLVMVFSSTEAFEDFVFEGTQFLAEASGTAWNAKGAAGDPLDPSQVRVISEVGGLYGGAVIGGFGVSVDRSMMRKAYGDAVTPRTILDDRGVVTPAGAATLWKSLGR
jgi:lipid-binding SYLF domain-containing protein